MRFMEGGQCFSCWWCKFWGLSRFGSGKWNACVDKQDECTSIRSNLVLLISLFSFLTASSTKINYLNNLIHFLKREKKQKNKKILT